MRTLPFFTEYKAQGGGWNKQRQKMANNCINSSLCNEQNGGGGAYIK